ncbi:sialate O-acetylesterase [Bifidobacterium ramosum]|nr:sialate O-acetylesterase [Bifidobacterium ramosum]
MSGLAAGAESDAVDKPIGAPELRPAAIFSHDMVLQRHRPIPVFGTGTPGRPVIVTLSEDGATMPLTLHVSQSSTAQTDRVSAFGTIDAYGDWLVTLPALEAGGPYELTVSDRSGITLKYLRVYVGEVWLAGGQSNMELELRNSAGADAAVAASTDPLLRFYNTPKTGVVDTDAEDHAVWQPSGPDTSGYMSAVAYYFARKLRAELGPDMPVGIVDCYIGGTSITSWMSRATLETCEAGRGYLARFDAAIAGKTDEQFETETVAWKMRFDAWNDAIGKARAAEPDITWDTLNARYGECPWPPPVTPTSQYRPTGPFGTMVERVAPYGIAGFLWYQGEEDEAYCDSYRELLPLLIGEWRGLWERSNDGEGKTDALPFLIVQLPQWIDKTTAAAHADPLHWPVIREAQWDAARTIANVYTITTIDCGEFDNIHPTDKRTPGERLADCALRHVYGRTDIAVDGPELIGATVGSAAVTGTVISTVTSARDDHDAARTADSAYVTDDANDSNVRVDDSADADGDESQCDHTITVALRFDHADGLHFDGTTPGTYGDAGADNDNGGDHNDGNDSGSNAGNGGADSGADGTHGTGIINGAGIANGTDDNGKSAASRRYREAGQSGFELAGADGIYHPADATIHGDTVVLHAKGGTVDTHSRDGADGTADADDTLGTVGTLGTNDEGDAEHAVNGNGSHRDATAVMRPVAVRYAWRSWGPASLFNGDGLPAPPFRRTL